MSGFDQKSIARGADAARRTGEVRVILSPEKGRRPGLRVLSQSTRVFVVEDKLVHPVREIQELVIKLGAQISGTSEAANVIVTSIRAPKRLLKHISREDSEDKYVVNPEWILDSAERAVMMDPDDYLAFKSSKEHVFHLPMKRGRTPDTEVESGMPGPSTSSASATRPPRPWRDTRYACERPSPLQCINQGLVDELEVIRRERELTGDEFSKMAYMRALSAIKAYPYDLSKNPSQASKLTGVGSKIGKLAEQYYEKGCIIEAKIIRRDKAIQTMIAFNELYGVGPTAARDAYNEGCRTLEDVIKKGKSLGTHLTRSESLRILPDLQSKIPRPEVEAIAHLISRMMEKIIPGCQHTICGGYRRGKPESSDVDIVYTHPDNRHNKAALHRLLDDLRREGIVTHIVSVTTPGLDEDSTNVHVDVAQIVVLPPISPLTPNPRHRRVDIIFCPFSVYGAAVLGWTGSHIFERDLRIFCRKEGYKFSFTGVTRLSDGKVLDTPTEREIFELFKLEWMPPEWRNCDA
ncbi:Nucleotidyltransferase [Violaceomyces palustris]|uniref:Nucleotidyltransferase n=1 Tax=Violaceomyces palustris TaxID=1673888 RepID=A0ACD0P7M2_9BASI|nr:Nucleotidyltransferase [Violaceomyces palustris]